ncbi:MAG: hypothetical protein JWN95_1530 [Frankiales bacterium]|nr:hypothetical protein [Frankiales bacterium]
MSTSRSHDAATLAAAACELRNKHISEHDTHDPLISAAASALACACDLLQLSAGSPWEADGATHAGYGRTDVLHALGAARALVGELTFAAREDYQFAAGTNAPDLIAVAPSTGGVVSITTGRTVQIEADSVLAG